MRGNILIDTKYLIIGNSAGAIGAAEAIREVDDIGSLAIVGSEPYLCYSRPLISKLVTGERSPEQILFRTADFYTKNKIELLSGVAVSQILPDKHLAILENGNKIIWERLLIATGGKPILPDISGLSVPGVFNFINIHDAISIAEYLPRVRRALVVGGGLIGLSVSEALVKRGLSVTIVELKERILNTLLDETASRIAEAAVKKAGVEIVVNHSVTKISEGSWRRVAVLDDGREIACDMVIMAVGVSPHVQLASECGLKVNRGILVDRNMACGHHVFACGDAAEAYDFIREMNQVIPIWPNAYIGGRTAGYNMAGLPTQYPHCTVMNSLNYFSINIVSAGAVTNIENAGYESVSRQEMNVYKKVVLEDGYIRGLVFINDIEKSGLLFGLMRDKVNVGGLKDRLLNADFGLADFPEQLRQERLGISSGNGTRVSSSKTANALAVN